MTVRTLTTLQINGVQTDARVALSDTLLTLVRDHCYLTGAKRGCNQGVCGACTVLTDGVPVRACITLALDCDDKQVSTIEGLGEEPTMQALQHAFINCGAFQCGFCTSGMLIAALALLRNNPRPSADDVRYALSGNLCRCTGYKKIVEAVLSASEAISDRNTP
ncbi:MAG TPA: (2Fe-2S)-binding protein [Xanthobacteraceae bacterium]|jgi:carbon-monoxide dehydrogenase small subunit